MSLSNLAYKTVRDRITQDPEFRESAFKALAVMDKKRPVLEFESTKGNKVEIDFIKTFAEAWEGRPHNLEERILIAIAWQLILSGDIIYHAIEVKQGPFNDLEDLENNKVLEDMIKVYKGKIDLVKAKCWSGKKDEDGVIVFKTPFIKNGQAKKFPLEIGTARPGQIFFRLLQRRCVARWPYGEKFIIFMENKGSLGSFL